MKTNEIKVEINYTIGVGTSVAATFSIDMHASYFDRDLLEMSTFLNTALNNARARSFDVTLTPKSEDILQCVNSKRFIVLDHINGYEERSYVENNYNQYPEAPAKTFGTEGNGRKEMKKRIVKVIKEHKNTLEVAAI